MARSVEIAYFLIEIFNGVRIQHGTLSAPFSVQTQFDITIPSAVNPLRSGPIVSSSVASDGDLDSNAEADSGNFGAVITNSTNLRLLRASNESRSAHMNWSIVEFDSE